MSNTFDFEFDMKALEREVEKLSGSDGLDSINKKSIGAVGKKILIYVKARMRVSKDVSKSGRKGSRTFQHARDNVPITTVKKGKGSMFQIIGWDKADTSPYFYEKFEEYGSSKHEPHPVFTEAKEIANSQLEQVYRTNLETYLKEHL